MTSVVRSPKKLRDICDLQRKQFDRASLPSRSAFPKFPAQVDAVLAQAAVFSADWPAAVDLGRKSVLAREQWYSGNFLDENLAALTFGAIRTGACDDAAQWAREWLASELDDLREHIRGVLTKQVEIQSLAMAGAPTGLREWKAAENPKPLAVFEAMLAANRKRVSADSVEGINYMLHFVATDGDPADFLKLYHRVAEMPQLSDDHHITAARIYKHLGDVAAAKAALLNWRRFGWLPVEATDILPMRLFTFFDLYPILSDQFLVQLRDCPQGGGVGRQ